MSNRKKENEKVVIAYVNKLNVEHLKHTLLDLNWTFKQFINICISGASHNKNIQNAIIQYYSSSLEK